MFKVIAGFLVDAILDKLQERKVIERGKTYAENVVMESEFLGKLRDRANDIISIPNEFFDGLGFQGTLLKQVIGLQANKLAESNDTVKKALSFGDGFYKELLDGIQPGEILERVLPFIEDKITKAAERVVARLEDADDDDQPTQPDVSSAGFGNGGGL